MAIIGVMIAAALFLPAFAYATGYPYDAPPQPLSIGGYVMNGDGSPADKGVTIYAVNEANGEFEETATGAGFPPSSEFYNRFKASLSFNPKEEQKVLVIAVFGAYYAKKEVFTNSTEEIGLMLQLDPVSAFSAANEVNTIHKQARAVLNEPVVPISQKNVFIPQILAVTIVILIIFFIFRPKPKKGKALHAVLLLLCMTGTLAVPSYAAGSDQSIFEAIMSFISGFLQPTALQVEPVAELFGPPAPVAVEGFVYNSDMSTVPNCTSVNATMRFPNGTIENLEQTCTGKGFPPVAQYYYKYKASLTGELGVDTVNVTAWNATHYGKNSTIAAANVNLTIILNETLPDTKSPTWTGNTTSIATIYSTTNFSWFNVTWSDNTAVTFGIFESNITGTPKNYTMLNATSVYYYYDIIPAGTYYWKSYANDSVGNTNATDTWYFTVNKAYNPVTMYLRNSTGEFLNQNITVAYGSLTNATGVSTNGTVGLYRDEVPKGSGMTMKSEIVVLPAKPAGWAYKVNATGNQNYSDNTSLTYYAIVNFATPTITVTFSPSSTVTYPTTTTAFCNISVGDQTATLTLERNGTSVSSGSGNRSYTALLGGGAYNFTCTYAASENYTGTASADNYLVVNKASNTVHLYLNGTFDANYTTTYPAVTNATATATGGTVKIYRDEVEKASGTSPRSEIAQLAARTGNGYVYKVNATGNENYSDSAAPVIYYLKINMATSTTTLTVNPPTPITYGTTTTASCSDNNPEATSNLYRNDTPINGENGVGLVLAAGAHAYVCNVTQTENYTSDSSFQIYAVNKADLTSSLHIAIDGSETDQQFKYPHTTNTTGWSTAGVTQDLVFNLYRNGALIGAGNPNPDNVLLGVNSYTYIYNTSGGQNYTSGTTSARSLVITKGDNPADLFLDGNRNIDNTVTYGNTTNATGTIYWGAPHLYRDGVEVGNPEIAQLAATTYAYKVNGTGGQNYSDNFTGVTYNQIVNKADPSGLMHIAINGTESSQSYVYTTVTNSTGWTTLTGQTGITYNLYFNGASKGSGASVPHVAMLGAGNHTYVYNTTGNQNYTNGNQTRLLNITKATPGITFTITPSQTVTYPTQTTTSCSATSINNEVAANLYRGGSFVSSPDVVTLGQGAYNYVCNSTVTQNYSSTTDTKTLTVNQNSTPTQNMLHLSLNGTIDGDKTYTYEQLSNATAYSDMGDVSITLYRNGTSVGSGAAPTETARLGSSVYNYTVYFPGNANYSSGSITHYATVDKKTINIYLALNGVQGSFSGAYGPTLNATAWKDTTLNNEGTQALFENDTNTGSLVKIFQPTAGYYTYKTNFTAANYTASDVGYSATISKATPTINLVSDCAWAGVTYGATCNVTGSTTTGDSITTQTLERNGSTKATGAVATEIVKLGGGAYNYTYNYPGSQNYLQASTSNNLVINKASNTVHLYLNGNLDQNLTITYPASSNATATATGGTINLYRNEAPRGISEVVQLAANTYAYKVNATGNDNYTDGSSITYYLIINKITSTATLSVNPPTPITYGTQTTAVCTENNPEASGNLHRNGNLANSENNTAITLGASSYTYVCNVSATENYTFATASQAYVVNQGSITLTLLLDGANSDQTYNTNSQANFTITTSPSGIPVQLQTNYSDGNNKLWDSGNSPFQNITTMSTLGKFNFTGVFNGNQNLTAAQATHYATVSDTTPPKTTVYEINTTSVMRGGAWKLYAQWDKTISSSLTEYNSTSSLQNVSTQLVSGTWTNHTGVTDNSWTPGVHLFKFYANDSYNNWNGTLPYKTMTMQGWSGSTAYTNSSSVMARDPVKISCRVADANTTTAISNYRVDIYNTTTLINTSATDANGWFNYTWTPQTQGNQTLTCAIYNNATQYYVAAYNSSVDVSVSQYIPGAPGNLSIDVYNETTGQVILNWTYSNSSDVAGYIIYATTNYTAGFNFSNPYYVTNNTTNYWIDQNSSNYDEIYYIVRTNDSISGVTDGNNITLGKYNLKLYTGWNLVSVPLLLYDYTATDVFYNSEEADEIWSYNASNPTDPYDATTYYAGFGWFGDFTSIENDPGYWYNSMKPGYTTTPFNVTLTGIVPTASRTFAIYNSWNLIGLTSVTPKDMNSVFATPSDEDEMWRYDAYDSTDPYKKETQYAGYGWYGDFRNVEDGRGYWYKSNNASSYNWIYTP